MQNDAHCKRYGYGGCQHISVQEHTESNCMYISRHRWQLRERILSLFTRLNGISDLIDGIKLTSSIMIWFKQHMPSSVLACVRVIIKRPNLVVCNSTERNKSFPRYGMWNHRAVQAHMKEKTRYYKRCAHLRQRTVYCCWPKCICFARKFWSFYK